MNNCSRGKLLVDLVKKYKEAEKVEQNLNAISEENHNIMQEVAACTSSQNPIITESSSQNYADFDEISNDFSSDDTIRDKTWQPEDDQEVNFTLNETNFSAEENIDPNKNREHENVSVISRNNDGTEENNENCEGVKKSRKRKRNVENWSQNIRKSNKNSGKSYTTMKGKIIPEKKVRIACPGSCKFKCNMLFDETMRQKIFDNFWGLSDLSLQRNFIAKNVDKVVTKYRYTREGSKRIGLNHAYNFYNSEGDRTRVCKKFFMTTLDVGDRFIRTAILKIKDNLHSIDEDRRGKHNNHQKIPEDVLTSIKDHINSFPRIEAHYIRKQTEREYIEGSLTIAEMYRLYKKKCAENNIEPAKLCTYSKVFNECFNISFFLPKKDQCAFCAKYNNCSNEEKCWTDLFTNGVAYNIAKFEKKNPTYEVNELNYKDFLDLKKLTEDLGKNFNINSRKEKKTRKSTSNIPTEMSNVFSEPVGISAQKKKDLTDLCDKLLIPENHHYFYKNLKISTQSVEEHK
ncbi:uncharacterized protein LOC129609243 [Condylostylus longicornis]|uniref:uncharacterized protein LOC129609243 n=1 Tax=Condylostylus longicornis TaxID=2530218 RepID=UPI00244E3E4E|nr:uncharacterized protein LOC129609243 [Condylostylus longicornis]